MGCNLLAVSRDSFKFRYDLAKCRLCRVGRNLHTGRNGDVEFEPSDFRVPRKKICKNLWPCRKYGREEVDGGRVGSETGERKIHSGPSVVEPPYTLLITNQVAHQVIGTAFPPVQIRTR